MYSRPEEVIFIEYEIKQYVLLEIEIDFIIIFLSSVQNHNLYIQYH